MAKIRVAVVGAGRLGGFHAQKLAKNPDVQLVGVADPFAMSRNKVAVDCACEAIPDFRLLRGRIDAAVIATPTALHHSVAKEMLGWGVHLLVEKPFCSETAQAEELLQIAHRKRCILQVGHVERFNPAFTAATEKIGAPKYVEAVRSSGYTFRSTDIGVVLDLMIHDIDLVLSMVDSKVRRVDALGVSVVGGHEDVANARIQFDNGCVAALSASRVSYEAVRRMHVWSMQGFAAVDFATRTATYVRPSETLRTREFDVDTLAPDEVERCRANFAQEHLPKEEKQFDAVDALALESQDFISAIRDSKSPRVTGEAGRNAVALAEEILDRIHNHAWDASIDGPVGPLALPRRRVIPAPHFQTPASEPVRRREAG